MTLFSKAHHVFLGMVVGAALIVSGCNSTGPKQQSGTAIGAVVGGLIGAASGGNNRAGKVLLGAVIGGLIGGSIGKSMDDRDRAKARQALEYNRTGQTMAWTNPDSGNSYRVTPRRTYRDPETRQDCREYDTEAYVNGRREQVYGRACRDEQGNWRERG